MKKFSVVVHSFFLTLLLQIFYVANLYAAPLTMTFDATPIGCRSTLPTSYTESGMRVSSSSHVHVCENHQGQTQSLRNHRGSTTHTYFFEYSGGEAFDLISFDLSTRFRSSDTVEWHPGRSTFTSSEGGSATIDTLGTTLFSAPEWQNITWLKWDQGINTQYSIRNTNTILDNLLFQPSIAPVPEPATVLLLTTGIFGIFGWRFFFKNPVRA